MLTVHIAQDATRTMCGQHVTKSEDRNTDYTKSTCYYCSSVHEKQLDRMVQQNHALTPSATK